MRTQILEILKNEKRALDVHEINDALNLSSLDEFKDLLKELNSMQEELLIRLTNKDKYILFDNDNLKIGFFISKKNFGFVDIEGDIDVFVPPNCVNNAIHGDKVIVEITSKKGVKLEGRIYKIVDRKLKNMVGEIIVDQNNFGVKLDDKDMNLKIIVDKDKTKGAVEGSKVVVKLTNKLENNTYRSEVVEVIGHKNDPGVDILSVARKYDINEIFSSEATLEAENITTKLEEADYVGRRDLKEKMIFTIDGDDTKDIDDAISLEILENGNYKLGVHIADVSYYVKDNTALYKDAFERGTSVYLADRVIPMLPHSLSNGICSLNPNVDRLAISCDMEINKSGDIISYDIYESVIKSRIQMTYKKVNKVIEEDIIPDGYEEYAQTLKNMKDVADILRKNKEKRGYIDFGIDESKIIVDESGKAVDVQLRERGSGEKMIEDYMIAANETVATCIYFMELPFIFRIHSEPNEIKIRKFLAFVSGLGYKIDGRIKEFTPKTMQMILEQLSEKKEYHILSSLLLRSMSKAIYDTNNIGHFGLASERYTHFTSPIRRFPDTTVHRLLRKYLFKADLSRETVSFEEQQLPIIAEHSSLKERNAVDCEREVDDMKKAEYMMDHIGEKYTGMISSIVSFGMFIELPNLIEGLIKVDELKDDIYVFDESTICMIGKNSKKIYRLGDDIEIIVSNANKEARTVDFVPYNEKTAKRFGIIED
ncbi:MAG: ribonuclease R [Bacilli bacterium]